MPKFIKAWLLPLLSISINGILGWLINQLPNKPDNIPPSIIIGLTVGCILLEFLLALLSSDAQQNSALQNQNNWVGGFLPLLLGVILAVPLYLKLIPEELITFFYYTSIILFCSGVVLPPVLILPRPLRKLLLWVFPGVGLFVTVHFILQKQSIPAIISLFLTVIVTILIASQEFFRQLITELSTIWKQWQRQGALSLATWLKNKLEDLWLELTSPFKHEYYQALRYKCRDYETQGLDKDRVLKLQKVFVPLKIVAKDSRQVKPGIIQEVKNEVNNKKEKQIWDFLAAMLDDSAFRRIVILGTPGSGKTTLLRHLTLIYVNKQERELHPKTPKLIPLLLYLRDVRHEIVNKQLSLAELITQQVKAQRKIHPLNPPANWFANKLRENKCLVMLDGLDEVADETERDKVRNWVDEQMQAYPDTAFILTSRPFGYKTVPLQQEVIVLEVRPFNLKQMEQFIRNWYLETEVKSRAGEDDLQVHEEVKRQADDLINRINNSAPLATMAVNPLLLTMIATVHRRGNVLPGKRVELYKEICQVLLERRQRAKNIPDTLTATQKQTVLQELALGLMQMKTRDFKLPKGISLIRNKLATVAGSQVKPEEFFQQIRDISGLLVEKEVNEYEFAHLSFQEYLAAVQIKESIKEEILIQNIDSSWWAETIRLYAGQSNASNLIRTVLVMSSPSVEAMTLAYDCLEEGLIVDEDVRQQMEERLKVDLESR